MEENTTKTDKRRFNREYDYLIKEWWNACTGKYEKDGRYVEKKIMKTSKGKPTKCEIDEFNREYDKVMERLELLKTNKRALVKEAEVIDRMAEKLYWKSQGGKDGKGRSMYYRNKDGFQTCVSKSVTNKIDKLNSLRFASLELFIG